jgi:hypothetical protein
MLEAQALDLNEIGEKGSMIVETMQGIPMKSMKLLNNYGSTREESAV